MHPYDALTDADLVQIDQFLGQINGHSHETPGEATAKGYLRRAVGTIRQKNQELASVQEELDDTIRELQDCDCGDSDL